MKSHTALTWFVRLTLACAASAALADVSLPYGGRLADASGKPRASNVDLEFRFFHQASGGSPAANVVIEHDDVALVNGVFQRSLTLSDANAHTIFAAGQAVWIEVKDVTNGVTYPRQQFGVVPFALKVPVDGTSITYDANGQLMSLSGGSGNMHSNDYDADLNDKADVADDADLLGGQPGSHYLNAANFTGTIADARIPAGIARDSELPVVDGTTVAAAGAVMDGDFSSNGIMARTGAGAYGILTDNSTNWNNAHTTLLTNATNWTTAYTDRMKWDGEPTGLNASTGRTSLGLGTIATQAASNVAITGGTISGVTMTGLTSTGIDDNADVLAMTIDANERVGIRTASPSAILDVVSDNAGGEMLYLQRFGATAPNIKFRGANGTAAAPTRANDANNIGYLDFYAYTRNAADTADEWTRMSHISNFAYPVDAQGRAGATMTFNTVAQGGTNPSERMRITSTGNVGIGTNVPFAKTHVADDIDDAEVTAGGGQLLLGGTTTATKRLILGYNTASNYGFLQGNTFGSTWDNIVLQPNGANVGIGVTNPTQKLEINGQIKITGGSPGVGKVLTSDANGVGSWGNAGGAMVLLSTQTASNSAEIQFTGLDGTYKNYMIMMNDVVPTTHNTQMRMQVSLDGGSTWRNSASDYRYAIGELSSLNGSWWTDYSTGTTSMEITRTGLSNTAGHAFHGTLTLFNPAGNRYKYFKIDYTFFRPSRTSMKGGGPVVFREARRRTMRFACTRRLEQSLLARLSCMGFSRRSLQRRER